MTKKQTRYVSSWGLAFAEEREMEMLSKQAAEGWLLEDFAFLGYRLRKGEPQNRIYCLDIQTLASEPERREYIEMFEAAGWTQVCSRANLHIFSAPPGTKPIYTDAETKAEKYKRGMKITSALALLCSTAALAGYTGYVFTEYEGLYFLSSAAIVIAVPSLMTYFAFLFRKKRAQG